jgi:3-hydroxyisobutyrate dehydrogenase-like beta-hydroxyacid dehydrogenase
MPHFMGSPAEVARSAQFIQIFVEGDAALNAVLTSMLPALTPDHVVMNHSTVSPTATHAAFQAVAATGAGFLDCPFTGSKLAAQNARLVYYVGGDAAVLERARHVLEASSSQLMHVGAVGDATVLKLATNLLTAITVKGLAEALALTIAYGLDPARLQEALEPNANYSPLVGMKLNAMIQNAYEPHFSLKNMLKDANYALALGAEKGVSLMALAITADAMEVGVADGRSEEDFSVIAANS